MHQPPRRSSNPTNPSYGLPSFTALLLLMLIVLATGCAAAKYEKRGDRSFNTGDAVAARGFYERALAHKP